MTEYTLDMYKGGKGTMKIEVRDHETGNRIKLFELPVSNGVRYVVNVYGDVHEN